MDQQRELSMLQQNRVDDILRREYPRSEKRFFVAAKDASRSDPTRDDSQTASPSTLPILGFVTWDVLPLGTSEAEWQAEHDKDHGLPPLNAFIAHSNPVAKAIVGVDIPHIRMSSLLLADEFFAILPPFY